MLGHMNPAGYLLTAKMTMAYIDYIIRSDFKAFRDVGFIGTDLYDNSPSTDCYLVGGRCL